jgi:hypothetical protein
MSSPPDAKTRSGSRPNEHRIGAARDAASAESRREALRRGGQWESGGKGSGSTPDNRGSAKRGGGSPQGRRPRAPREPPAGAAGAGGKQGRSPQPRKQLQQRHRGGGGPGERTRKEQPPAPPEPHKAPRRGHRDRAERRRGRRRPGAKQPGATERQRRESRGRPASAASGKRTTPNRRGGPPRAPRQGLRNKRRHHEAKRATRRAGPERPHAARRASTSEARVSGGG